MKITIRDEKTGRSFDLEVYPENTPSDVISTLIEEGYIHATPGGNPQYMWVLQYAGRQLDPGLPLVQQGIIDGAELTLVPVPTPG